MGVKNLPEITTALLDSGLDGDTPAAVVADAGLPTMTVLRSTAGAVAEAAARAGIRPPAVCVIGAVAGLGLT